MSLLSTYAAQLRAIAAPTHGTHEDVYRELLKSLESKVQMAGQKLALDPHSPVEKTRKATWQSIHMALNIALATVTLRYPDGDAYALALREFVDSLDNFAGDAQANYDRVVKLSIAEPEDFARLALARLRHSIYDRVFHGVTEHYAVYLAGEV